MESNPFLESSDTNGGSPGFTGNIKIISAVSWILLAITSIISFFAPNLKTIPSSTVFWLSVSIETFPEYSNFPIIMLFAFIYISFYILIISCVASCCVILFFMLKSQQTISGMFEKISQFHFIPVLCATSLFIIGEVTGAEDIFLGYPNYPMLIFDLLFSFIGFGSLILVHIKTDLSNSKIARYIIKQLTYGSLIVLFLYNFCFGVGWYGLKVHRYNLLDYYKFRDHSYLAFSIMIGIVNLGLSFALKNVVIAIMNIIIYCGMVFWFFFEIPLKQREAANGQAEGIVDIIIMVLSGGVIAILFTRFRGDIINGK